jgi:hypothetical protein
MQSSRGGAGVPAPTRRRQIQALLTQQATLGPSPQRRQQLRDLGFTPAGRSPGRTETRSTGGPGAGVANAFLHAGLELVGGPVRSAMQGKRFVQHPIRETTQHPFSTAVGALSLVPADYYAARIAKTGVEAITGVARARKAGHAANLKMLEEDLRHIDFHDQRILRQEAEASWMVRNFGRNPLTEGLVRDFLKENEIHRARIDRHNAKWSNPNLQQSVMAARYYELPLKERTKIKSISEAQRFVHMMKNPTQVRFPYDPSPNPR